MDYKPDKLIQVIKKLIDFEIDRSKKENDERFNTVHEGWAIVKEEIEEYGDELDKIRRKLSGVNRQFEIVSNCHNDELWKYIKNNNYDSILKEFEKLYLFGINSIIESIQMTAMFKKNIEYFNCKMEGIKND